MSAARLAALLAIIKENDRNYEKRTLLVYQALGEAAALGYRCGIRYDREMNKKSKQWPVVVIELPLQHEITAEVAWHCAATKLIYDGHSDEEKYKRIEQYCAESVRNVFGKQNDTSAGVE